MPPRRLPITATYETVLSGENRWLTGQRAETQPQVAADLQIPAADIDLIKRAMRAGEYFRYPGRDFNGLRFVYGKNRYGTGVYGESNLYLRAKYARGVYARSPRSTSLLSGG